MCNNAFHKARRMQRTCSDECEAARKAAAREACRGKALAIYHAKQATKPVRLPICQECGKQFEVDRRHKGAVALCSDECRWVAHRRNVGKGRSKRRALEANAFVETVDPIAVFEAARWKCQLCGQVTPRMARGTYVPCAPELDHIIPLSRGGLHKRDNVQCLCRQCNSIKSNRFEPEM
jgi:5-methylcytosine-specific restriction endonuclease McrA